MISRFKFAIVLMCFVLILSLTACGGGSDQGSSGPLTVVANGPYEVWVSNTSPDNNYSYMYYYYYFNLDQQGTYTKIGEATSTATFDTGNYNFIAIVTRSLVQIDAVQMPNGEYLKDYNYTPDNLKNILSWGNISNTLVAPTLSQIYSICGPPDGQSGYMGSPLGSGVTTGRTFQGFLLLKNFSYTP